MGVQDDREHLSNRREPVDDSIGSAARLSKEPCPPQGSWLVFEARLDAVLAVPEVPWACITGELSRRRSKSQSSQPGWSTMLCLFCFGPSTAGFNQGQPPMQHAPICCQKTMCHTHGSKDSCKLAYCTDLLGVSCSWQGALL